MKDSDISNQNNKIVAVTETITFSGIVFVIASTLKK